MLRRFITRIRQMFSAPAAVQAEEELRLDLIIAGVSVFVVEGVRTGAVKFWEAEHPLNPTEGNMLACDLDTYVSLAARPDSQRLVAHMVNEALLALRVKKRAEYRRERRNAKRARQVTQE